MKHRKQGKKLGRNTAQRKSLYKILARSFFVNQGKIKTTLPKAKAVQPRIEKMITRAKDGSLASRRWLYRYFQDQKLVNDIVKFFGKKVKNKPGGYTRIIKVKKRRGDDATIARLELVDQVESGEE